MSEVKINWAQIENQRFLKFTFGNYLGKDGAFSAITQWEEIFASSLDEVPLIWDCKLLIECDTVARILWKDAIGRLKPKIQEVWLLTDANAIKLNSLLVSMFNSVKIKMIYNEEKLRLNLKSD